MFKEAQCWSNRRRKRILTNEEQDEEFERDFLRAVDRALGVVNKDDNNFLQTNEDLPTTKSTDESTLNLQQITEQALSSFQSSPLFQVRDDRMFTGQKGKYFFFDRMRNKTMIFLSTKF